ncbi:MAG: hypothetical protein DRN05_01850 [Thermoplasmata archaeon]|nr:MAG: hypothetical protein DRN05_01850 [Thermoplasmata archaeon]
MVHNNNLCAGGDEESMYRVDVILDMGPEYLIDIHNNKKHREYNQKMNRGKTIKIDDKLFEIALNEGLIEKTEDGYVFVGRFEDTLTLKELKKRK